MIKNRIVLISIFLLLPLNIANSAPEADDFSAIIYYNYENSVIEILNQGQWSYFPEDNPAFADPGYDDSSWEVVNTYLSIENKVPWNGIGWFRIHLKVDSTAMNHILAMTLRFSGATELYLDGKLIDRKGIVSPDPKKMEHISSFFDPPIPLSLNDNDEHILAIRYSNHQKNFNNQFLVSSLGYLYEFGDPEILANNITAQFIQGNSEMRFFVGIAITLAFLHILLYILYPKIVQNLYFSCFAFSMAMLTWMVYRNAVLTELEALQTSAWLFKLSVIAVSMVGMHFIYFLYVEKIRLRKWFSYRQHHSIPIFIFHMAGIILIIFAKVTSLSIIYLFGFLAMIEQIRMIIYYIIKKKDGIWIIGIGYFLFFLGVGIQMLYHLQILGDQDSYVNTYLWGFIAMAASMSIYLARQFAKTNIKLENQIKETRKQSARALGQERLVKQREMEKLRLEEENKRKALEIEEAKKLKDAHKRLAETYKNLEQANIELKSAQTRLVQSEKMASLGMLVAGVAHEINTPVGAIRSMHDTLMRSLSKLKSGYREFCKLEEEDTREFEKLFSLLEEANKVIASGTERVINIIKRLKSFARLDESDLKKVDIHEGIEDTLVLVHHELKHRAVIVRNFGDVPPIACYPSRLNQVFLNLLVNAGQAIKEKGTITISTEKADNKVLIKISDTGIGIPEDKIGKIFDPGYTTKGVGVGTGLGLSICYQIVEDHKGTISVESEVGVGTTFIITLPLNLEEIKNSKSK